MYCPLITAMKVKIYIFLCVLLWYLANTMFVQIYSWYLLEENILEKHKFSYLARDTKVQINLHKFSYLAPAINNFLVIWNIYLAFKSEVALLQLSWSWAIIPKGNCGSIVTSIRSYIFIYFVALLWMIVMFSETHNQLFLMDTSS